MPEEGRVAMLHSDFFNELKNDSMDTLHLLDTVLSCFYYNLLLLGRYLFMDFNSHRIIESLEICEKYHIILA